MSTFQVVTEDGIAIKGEVIEARGPKAIIQINPAAGTKASFYRPFAEYLRDEGYSVCLFDYRGIGKSRNEKLRNISYLFRDYGLRDVPVVVEYLKEKYPELPLYLIGHSVGGQQIGIVPNNPKIAGLLAVAVSTGFRAHMPFSYSLQATFFFKMFSPVSSFANGYVAAKKFNIMEDLPTGVVKEWGDWSDKKDYLFHFLGKTIPQGNYDQLPFPVTVFYASDDEIATDKNVESFWKHVKSKDKINFRKVSPDAYGAKVIGHFGYFKKQFRESLWKDLVREISGLI